MQGESLEISLLSIFSMISFFIFFLIQKFSQKIFGNLIVDDDFSKPQSFHFANIPRSGGLAAMISFSIFVFLSDLLFSTKYFDYLTIGVGLFLIGFLEDIKFKLSPRTRLAIMAIFLLISIRVFSIEIYSIDLNILNHILTFDIFLTLFILFCLFV